jgi:hypothetical protein
MRPIRSVLGAAVIALLMSAPAMAQISAVPWATGLPNQPAFDRWAKNHQKAAAQLQANPGLAFSHAWRKRHPHFQNFIEKHPHDWAALKRNGARSYSPDFNRYLASNPGAAEQLRQNPEMLYDPGFRQAHPGVTKYMRHHPNVWQAAATNEPQSATAGDESPAEEATEHHHHWDHHQHGHWKHHHHGYWEHHHDKHWEHHEAMEQQWRGQAQMRRAHWQRWHQKHSDHDND